MFESQLLITLLGSFAVSLISLSSHGEQEDPAQYDSRRSDGAGFKLRHGSASDHLGR